MQTTSELEEAVARLDELLVTIGRRNSLRDPIAQAVEMLNLTPPQLHAILWLGREGSLTMGEVAQRVGVTEKTATGLVDRLEREGYAQRDRDSADRRVVRVRLGERGQSTYAELSGEFRKKMTWMLAVLDPEDRTALFRILEKLVERLTSGEPPHP